MRVGIVTAVVLVLLMSGSAAQSPAVVIDPTKNVLDVVNAQEKYQNLAREYEAKLRDAETRRIKEMSEQKQMFDLELAKILRANVDSASLLLATQLKELKTDLSERMTKQEQYRWEMGGKFTGANDLWGYIVGAIGLLFAAASLWSRFMPR